MFWFFMLCCLSYASYYTVFCFFVCFLLLYVLTVILSFSSEAAHGAMPVPDPPLQALPGEQNASLLLLACLCLPLLAAACFCLLLPASAGPGTPTEVQEAGEQNARLLLLACLCLPLLAAACFCLLLPASAGQQEEVVGEGASVMKKPAAKAPFSFVFHYMLIPFIIVEKISSSIHQHNSHQHN